MGEHVSEIHFKKIMSFCDLNKTGEVPNFIIEDIVEGVQRYDEESVGVRGDLYVRLLILSY